MCFRDSSTTSELGPLAPRRRLRRHQQPSAQAQRPPGFPAGRELIPAPHPPAAADHSEAGPSISSSLPGRESGRDLDKEGRPIREPLILPDRNIGIGIETEFLLQGRDRWTREANIVDFTRKVSHLHNQEVREEFPRMVSEFSRQKKSSPSKHSTWSLVYESTVETQEEPWGLEMTSPILQAYRGSTWREQVKATWAVLADHYRVRTNECCSTHVHVSVYGGFSLRDVKNIAQCVLHFEPAVEVLVPAERRYNYYSKGNWINNRNLAGKNLSRVDSIAKIEACENTGQLIALMHPGLDRFFGWNFRSLSKLNTIEFRKGAGSRNADEALAWAELAMTFVRSAMKSDTTPNLLRRVPPNIRGLHWFLLREKAVEGISDPGYLVPLFADKLPQASITPLLYLQTPADIISMLERKIEEDRRRNASVARSLEVPSN